MHGGKGVAGWVEGPPLGMVALLCLSATLEDTSLEQTELFEASYSYSSNQVQLTFTSDGALTSSEDYLTKCAVLNCRYMAKIFREHQRKRRPCPLRSFEGEGRHFRKHLISIHDHIITKVGSRRHGDSAARHGFVGRHNNG